MKNLYLFLAVFIALPSALIYASTIDDISPCVVYIEQPRQQEITIRDTVFGVYIKALKGKDTLKPLINNLTGTGFFVGHGNYLFLVTAYHVAKELMNNARIIVRDDKGKPFELQMQDIWNRKGELFWSVSPEGDIAVLSLNPSLKTFEHLKGHFIPLDLLDSTQVCPSREITLTVIGFPLGMGVNEWFSPISQEVKPSSGYLTLPRADNHKPSTFFILDKPSVGGFSGAPVFELPGVQTIGSSIIMGGNISCVGLIHGTSSDDTGGKFALVVPSYIIYKTIKSGLK